MLEAESSPGGESAVIWEGWGEVPSEAYPDVIVADGGAMCDASAERPTTERPLIEPGPHRPGVIRIGDSGPADVRLSADATPREVRLACRLLGEIVRLRRQQQDGAEVRRRLSEEALTDPLTGLPNRRAWQQTLQSRMAEVADMPGDAPSPTVSRRLCVAVADLDHFKRINDNHGHAAGDAVLRASGRAIRDGLRENDFVARIGGDEFALLLWVPDEATAAMVVERVRNGLPKRLAQAGTHVVTASVGYCLIDRAPHGESSRSPDGAYSDAAAALRQAKHGGRDRSVVG